MAIEGIPNAIEISQLTKQMNLILSLLFQNFLKLIPQDVDVYILGKVLF
jgi:hypothetical protein